MAVKFAVDLYVTVISSLSKILLTIFDDSSDWMNKWMNGIFINVVRIHLAQTNHTEATVISLKTILKLKEFCKEYG